MSMQVKVGVVVVGPPCNLRRLPRKYPDKNRMTKNETESSQTKNGVAPFLYIYCTTCHLKQELPTTHSIPGHGTTPFYSDSSNSRMGSNYQTSVFYKFLMQINVN